MKLVITIWILVMSVQTFGQEVDKAAMLQVETTSFHLITTSCKEVPIWSEKVSCSNSAISQRINTELHYGSVLDKLNEDRYRIYCTFWFNDNGELIKKGVRTENEILKTEIERIMNSIDLDISLMYKNGNYKAGAFILPLFLKVEN